MRDAKSRKLNKPIRPTMAKGTLDMTSQKFLIPKMVRWSANE
jgi:hypothetical protein